MRRGTASGIDFPLVQDAFPLLFLVAVFVLLWLVFIRPQGRRQRELAHMQATLEVGDEVMLTSGVYGVLRAVDEADVRVEIAEGVAIRVARGAIGQVVNPVEKPEEPVDDEVSEEN
jgi:preprotein translocase subunit YajC